MPHPLDVPGRPRVPAQGRVTLRQRPHHSSTPDTWRYTWDSQDRLIAVQTPDGTTWSYRYDPLGRRIGKYHHSPDGGIAEGLDLSWDGPRLVESLRWRPDGTIKATTWDYQPNTLTPTTQTDRSWLATSPQTEVDRRFHTIVCDLVGAPTHLITPDGDTTWHAQTTIWGASVTTTGGAVDCPLRFPGQYHDPETGHHYNNQRHYDPEAGRYLAKDPLGLGAGSNPSQYTINPTCLIDPFGLMECYEDFAHGTSVASADNIMQNGLSEIGARTNEYHSHVPGSFFTVPVDPDDVGSALDTAAYWGARTIPPGVEGRVLVLSLPTSVVEDLTARGLLERTSTPLQAVFHPGSYETISEHGQWVASVPFVRPRG